MTKLAWVLAAALIGSAFVGLGRIYADTHRTFQLAQKCRDRATIDVRDIGRCKPTSHVRGPDGKFYLDFSCEGGAHLLLPLGSHGA
jgi:hypothetical protein